MSAYLSLFPKPLRVEVPIQEDVLSVRQKTTQKGGGGVVTWYNHIQKKSFLIYENPSNWEIGSMLDLQSLSSERTNSTKAPP